MANTTSPAKKYYDQANQAIDEQAILDKYNAATTAQFNVQREQNRQAENNFYNQMYNTQKTAMDTIRQSNAAAVSSGASRGVQAANELSALLGLQQESVASATELAQANKQTAQEETAAVLENVLKAYQQAQQERAQMVQHGIEAASVDVQSEANQVAAQQANIQHQDTAANLITQAAENGTTTYLNALGDTYTDGVYTPESATAINTAFANIGKTADTPAIKFEKSDWSGSKNAGAKVDTIVTNIKNICDAFGLDSSAYTQDFQDLKTIAQGNNVNFMTSLDINHPEYYNQNIQKDINIFAQYGVTGVIQQKQGYADAVNAVYNTIINKIKTDYATGINRKVKK